MTLLLALLLAAPADASVFIVRHAERLDAKADASPLSARGKRRAELLKKVLSGVPLRAVYASEYERAQQTGRPTAASKGLKLEASADEAALAARLKALPAEDDVLVVGHTDTIPGLLKALGVADKVEIPSDQYDNLFIVTPRKDAAPLFHRLRY